MNYKDLDLNISYISRGDNNIADSFLVPALKLTKVYQRSVGFFSSGVFKPIIDGIVAIARNGGKIQLIASPKLRNEDIIAISEGYRKRNEIIEESFSNDFLESLNGLNDDQLKLLATLIAKEVLDIKIAITPSIGDYHDKLGILEDFDGNVIVFYGSSNSSLNGYRDNYEKIRIVKGWIDSEKDRVYDEKMEFESLWDGTNPFVEVYDYRESAEKKILQVIDNRECLRKGNIEQPVKLRDYQVKAIDAWVENNYHGFYVMATGTGKTWTAIYSAKKLFESHQAITVICAPYKHLIKQWAEDLIKSFPKAKLIMASSENPNWDKQISEEILRKQYNNDTQIIIVSTIASFSTERFNRVINKSHEKKLLIVDEAHRFTDRSEELKNTYSFMLGLSATPFSGSSAEKGKELMKYFGGQVFNLPIEDALGKYLVNYYYHPIFVSATEDEENKFKYHTQKIISCFKNNKCINPDLLVKSLRNRLRVISMSSEKQEKIDDIIEGITTKDHFVIYCGGGKLFDGNNTEEMRHIRFVKGKLNDHGYKPSQFTAKENMQERMELVNEFNRGNITALAAIRCLDEGINIPSIKAALILSSNDDYREFVQRRGRILRQYSDKQSADIYDVIVLPSHDMQLWAKIELRRFLEYGRLSINWEELRTKLEELLEIYDLSFDDIDVYDYDEVEEPLDE